MRLIALLLCASFIARAEDGGLDAGVIELVDVERAQLVQADGGFKLVGSGCYFDERSCILVGKTLRGQSARILEDEKDPPPPSVFTLSIVAAVSLVAGVILGAYLVWKYR